ncbi:MAG: hypothetical protein Q8O92_08475 [Candidatus Latescibacter sp.]|nr:hypothetical protein [Candidatus Latescibacter sp.]
MGTELAKRILDNANNWLHRMAAKKTAAPGEPYLLAGSSPSPE